MLAPFKFGVDTITLPELLRNPAAVAIIKRHAPQLLSLAQLPATQSFMSNCTFADAMRFFEVDSTALVARIDAELQALPEAERPKYVW